MDASTFNNEYLPACVDLLPDDVGEVVWDPYLTGDRQSLEPAGAQHAGSATAATATRCLPPC